MEREDSGDLKRAGDRQADIQRGSQSGRLSPKAQGLSVVSACLDLLANSAET